MQRYNPKEIEPKWQVWWDEQGTYVADLDSDKPKYIGFGMFNYPSGAGIHVGHVKNFTLPDVLLRAKRQQGFEAYSPVGFDSFGLPAENYAIKTGQSPRKTTDDAIEMYRKQYRAVGFSQDWTKEIDTSHSDYYKWTQWCFLKLHENGLAYQKESMQWWCDQCKTVLADEQVIAGKCWRHDSESDPMVTKRSLNQWFFKITDYADEILEATDALNWTPWVKTAQKNWIGRSEGAEVHFKVVDSEEEIVVFTTRADTLFSAAFMVLAPEHPLVENLTSSEQFQEVYDYSEESKVKSELDRMQTKHKTGVFTGAFAINPADGREIPVWIADFVLAGYGTGAVFGDIHDERDFEFAMKYKIPAEPTVLPEDEGEAEKVRNKEYAYTGEGILIDSAQFTGMKTQEARSAIIDWLAEQGHARKHVNYKVRDWLISRQRYWGAPIPIIHCVDCGAVPVPENDLPVVLPELEDYKPVGDGRSPLAKATEWLKVPCPNCGKPGERETDTMDGYVCSSWYQLRYADPNNSEQAWSPERANHWLPVDFYNGGDHATAHLLYARFFTRFFHKLGLIDNPEPFARMYFHAKILAPDGTAFSKSKGNGVDPLSVINSGYGADALRTYIMFMAPPDVESPWNDDGVPGCYRFLNRIWVLTHEYLDEVETQKPNIESRDKEMLQIIHKTIKKVTDDIEAVKLNTAISTMMECTNDLYKIKEVDKFSSSSWKFTLESLLQLVAPFAPHIAEELWHKLGHEDSIHVNHWPDIDEQYLVSDNITLAIQVNGKVRAEITVPADSTEESIKSTALSQENVVKYLSGSPPKKVIYVTARLVSVVV